MLADKLPSFGLLYMKLTLKDSPFLTLIALKRQRGSLGVQLVEAEVASVKDDVQTAKEDMRRGRVRLTSGGGAGWQNTSRCQI